VPNIELTYCVKYIGLLTLITDVFITLVFRGGHRIIESGPVRPSFHTPGNFHSHYWLATTAK